MDRRLHPATDRIAHLSLKGKIESPAFSEGEVLRISLPLVDLLSSPKGARERQLLLGEGFTVVDRQDGYAFGFAMKDDYCGWLPDTAVTDTPTPTHWVATPGAHLYPEPRVQSREIAALSMGAQVTVLSQTPKFTETTLGFIPTPHLLPRAQNHADPVAVAETFLHTPYLWGGNSRAGIDCSGLVQGALLACGIACPGDADLQQVLGQEIAEGASLQRGDLIFWKGHVALIVDETRLIHANGHTMSVAYEGITECFARIARQDGTPIINRRRL
jgi:cell wall-associated NlpC family hydrolase